MIFPRYHQLDCVRKLVANAQTDGAGHNYLVQHSAGSGKSNSIAWLAHRLQSLHDASDNKVFDSIVVVTDRRVLDQQLQNAIYQFEHKQGVVVRIKEGSNERVQQFKGTVIRMHGSGNSESFTVRRIASNGIGVERTFLSRSPIVEKVTVQSQGHHRRSRLYFLRERSGKKAKLRQKFTS